MALYRDTGVVLRTWKLAEADRIVSVLTREHGKVRAVAKGVRKSGSRFGARLEPTCHVSIQLYRGKGELDAITQVELIERTEALRVTTSCSYGRPRCSRRSTISRSTVSRPPTCSTCWCGHCERSPSGAANWLRPRSC